MEDETLEQKDALEEKSRLAQIEEALDALERGHLREILVASRESGAIDAEQIKHVASYLRVVGQLLRVIQLRERESAIRESPSVRMMWEVLTEVPELGALLNDPGIKSQIMGLVRKRLERD